jgi:hypothetical protein
MMAPQCPNMLCVHRAYRQRGIIVRLNLGDKIRSCKALPSLRPSRTRRMPPGLSARVGLWLVRPTQRGFENPVWNS